MKKILIRADGNSEIGLGHVIRCCALADMLRDNFDCFFYIRNPSGYLEDEIEKSGCRLVNLKEDEDYIKEADEWSQLLSGDEIVLLDGYSFNTAYQERIKSSGCKLVCIDDIHAYHFVADAVINHAGGITDRLYSTEKYTKLYLGLSYALLRRPFLECSKNDQTLRKDNEVMICLGGADPNNETLAVVKSVGSRHPELHYHIILGAAYQYRDVLVEYLTSSSISHTLHSSLSAEGILSVMQQSGRAICSPSSVSIEYLSTKGELYLKVIADNQLSIYRYYTNNRIGFESELFFQPNNFFNRTLIDTLFDGGQKDRLIKLFVELN